MTETVGDHATDRGRWRDWRTTNGKPLRRVSFCESCGESFEAVAAGQRRCEGCVGVVNAAERARLAVVEARADEARIEAAESIAAERMAGRRRNTQHSETLIAKVREDWGARFNDRVTVRKAFGLCPLCSAPLSGERKANGATYCSSRCAKRARRGRETGRSRSRARRRYYERTAGEYRP